MPNEKKLVVAIISSERSVREVFASALEQHPQVEALWTLGEYPAPGQLAQIGEAPNGCVVCLDFADSIRARAIAAELDRKYPGSATIAIHRGARDQDLKELMQLGIREIVTSPLVRIEIQRAFERAARKLRRAGAQEEDTAGIFAFLPARPGSGATTIALHSAAAAARASMCRMLLIDFDLRLGMTSFLLKLHGEHSVTDALSFSGHLEETLWDRLVYHRETLDILGSAPVEFSRDPSEAGAAAVLDYARQRYAAICVDLPGEMRDHEMETLHRAKEIFLVCTPDLGTLHMAKRKADTLRLIDAHSRTSVILNRRDGRLWNTARAEVEDILQLPVRFSLPVADKEIAEATQKATTIEGRSAFAGELAKIGARLIAGKRSAEDASGLKRFIEFFSLTPVREKVGWRR